MYAFVYCEAGCKLIVPIGRGMPHYLPASTDHVLASQDLNATAQKWLESLLRPVESEEKYPQGGGSAGVAI